MENVNRLQNGESNIVLVASQSEIVAHPIDGRVGNVDPVQVSKEVHHAEHGDHPHIYPPHQRRLVDVGVHLLGGELPIAELGELHFSRGSRRTQSWWRVNVSWVG